MRVLVSGFARSGTSAFSKFLAVASGQELLHDPKWAAGPFFGPLGYREHPVFRSELHEFNLVKVVSMSGCLSEVVVDFPGLRVPFLFRDPRDVYCSVLEAGMAAREIGKRAFLVANPTYYPVGVPHHLGFIRWWLHNNGESLKLPPTVLLPIPYHEFVARKAQTVCIVGRELGWECRPGRLTEILEQQLGPAFMKRERDQSIKGVDRWKRELPPEISCEIERATRNCFATLKRRAEWLAGQR